MIKRIFLVFVICIIMCGCTSEGLANNILGGTISYSDREVKIQKSIEDLEGIYKSYVVIRGRAALIGIVLEKDYVNKAGELKALAAQKARLTDIEIKSTAVTCNPEITGMIQNLKNLER